MNSKINSNKVVQSIVIIAFIAIIVFKITSCVIGTEEICPPHTWGEDAVTAPTCTDPGYATQTCSRCHETRYTHPISAAGHIWSGDAATAPTCTVSGYTTQTCSRCHETRLINPISANHTWSGDAITAPTCTDPGYTTQTCPRCHETRQINPTPANHIWGGDAVTAPTCADPGYTTQTCSVCGQTQQINAAAELGHGVINWNTYNSGKVFCDKTDCVGGLARIGDTGPAGGKIFYVAPSGFPITTTIYNYELTAYYLEAAPENQGRYLAWASSGYTSRMIDSTKTVIGSGKENTRLILAIDAAAPAALACKNYKIGGKDDWFLPSKDELNELYKQRNLFFITSGSFWSSTNGNTVLGAWSQDFDSRGYQGTYTKSATQYVRAIRVF